MRYFFIFILKFIDKLSDFSSESTHLEDTKFAMFIIFSKLEQSLFFSEFMKSFPEKSAINYVVFFHVKFLHTFSLTPSVKVPKLSYNSCVYINDTLFPPKLDRIIKRHNLIPKWMCEKGRLSVWICIMCHFLWLLHTRHHFPFSIILHFIPNGANNNVVQCILFSFVHFAFFIAWSAVYCVYEDFPKGFSRKRV